MWSVSARDRASVEKVSGASHDAYIDGDIQHDRSGRVVSIPLLQEGWLEGPPGERVVTRETWRYREYRVTFFQGRLIVRQVQSLDGPHDWAAEPMIESVDFDAGAHQVRVCASSECLRLTVDALDIEMELSSTPGGHVQRRVGKFTGVERDRWLGEYATTRARRGMHKRRPRGRTWATSR